MALKCFVARTERKEIYSGFISRYIPISLVYSTIYWLSNTMGNIYQFHCLSYQYGYILRLVKYDSKKG